MDSNSHLTAGPPAEPPRPEREVQAIREIGSTAVSRSGALLLASCLLAPLVAVPVIDLVAGSSLADAARALAAGVGDARERASAGGARHGARALVGALEATEAALEDGSRVLERVQPRMQWVLTAAGGVGNEQVYLGRRGFDVEGAGGERRLRWLHYRQDVDYLTGPGFLEPAVLAARARGGDPWEPPPEPDPVAALTGFARQLEGLGIGLLVVPTPVKTAIVPETFTRRELPAAALDNPSAAELRRRLEAAGIAVFDPAPVLLDSPPAPDAYLATDTHWRPEAMERVARELARRIEGLLDAEAPEPPPSLVRRAAVVEGTGDLAALLRLPAGSSLVPPERVEVQVVTTRTGRGWRPDRQAEVLLLGDSFTNVFSDPALGWGAAAGLAEQLAFHLGRPLDRIAVNAGGPAAARRALAADPSRLAGKRLVVYQFAARELAFGDWEQIVGKE